MFELNQARQTMISQQIRPWNLQDEAVLEAMTQTPRELFTPTAYQNLAYSDTSIPLPHDQTLLEPKVVARALQALSLQKTDVVLELGTGTGYITALLSQLVQQIYSVELFADLLEHADRTLDQLGYSNVELLLGNGAQGWPGHAPYDVIMATGAYENIPEILFSQLKPDGRLFAIAGKPPALQAYLCYADRRCFSLFETDAPYLQHIQRTEAFIF